MKAKIGTLLFFMTISAARANLVVNGSFENPSAGTGFLQSSPLGVLGGWHADVDVVEIGSTAFYGQTTFDGLQVAELGGTFTDTIGSKASIYQDVPTVAGVTYNFTYSFTRRPSDTVNSSGFLGFWDFGGSNQSTLSLSMQNYWETVSYQAVASSSLTRIRFTEIGSPVNPGNGSLLDGVSVTAVPEPASCATIGLGVLGLTRRRRAARN